MATRKRGRSEGGACSEGPVTRSKASRLRSGLTLPLLPASKRQCVSSAAASPAAPGAKVQVRVAAQVPSGAAGSTRAATRKQAAELKGKGKLSMENTSDGSGHVEENAKTRVVDRKREKGKEKEGDTGPNRDMDRAARRAVATAQESPDEDGGGGAGSATVPPGTASSALQGLLRKLGAGLDDLMLAGSPALSSGRLKTILIGLRADGEEGRQLEALSSLCELLSIGTEDSLSSFSVDAFVPVLVNLLNCEYNSDIMLLAARALTHLTDVLPNACQTIVHYGAVPAFCARLLTIEYIDLAEQSLQALEKISFEHPTAVLRAGGLLAVLSYLDFFSTGVQRVALSTAANICRQLPSDSVELIRDAVPILTNLLQYQDEKVVEHACVCLSRIAENWAPSSQKLDLLCSHGLIAQAARLIAVPASGAGPQAALSVATYTGLVRLLATCAAGSPAVVEALLEQGIITILRDALAGAAAGPAAGVGPAALTRSPEQLYELMSLVSELLPPVGDPGVALPAIAAPEAGNRAARRKAAQEAGASLSAVKEEPGGEASSARERWLAAHPGLVEQYGRDLFPVLLQVYAASVNPAVRSKCLTSVNKYLHFVRPDTLQLVLKESNIAGFLAGVLVSKDAAVLNTALQIAEGLMAKLPEVFRRLFVKEGVLHALDALVATEPSLVPLPEAAGPSMAEESGAGTSTGLTRPKRANAKQRRKEEESEAAALGASGKEGHLALGRGEVEATGPSSLARALVQPGSGRAGLRLVAAARARRLKETYFGGGESESDDAARLKKLKELCAQICGGGKPAGEKGHKKAGKHKGKRCKERGGAEDGPDPDVAALKDVLDLLLEGDGVSTFEFVGSGVAPALLKLLTHGQAADRKPREAAAADAQPEPAQALVRLHCITDLLLPPAATAEDAPLTLLVRKLQAALTSLERFPVMLSQAPAGARALGAHGGGGVAGGLSALTQPFKLRLSRAAGETALRDYSSNVVLIEPLATLAAVEDFLWHRVRGRADAPAVNNGASTSNTTAAEAQLEAALAAAAAQFAANGRAGGGDRAGEGAAGTSAGGESRPLTRAQKREAAMAAASQSTSRKQGAGSRGSQAPGTAAEPRVTRAAARRRAEASEPGAGQEERGVASGAAGGEHHQHELDSEEEADLHGMEYEEGLAMMEEDDDMSEDEEVYGEEALPIPDSVHDVQLGGDLADATAPAAPGAVSRHAASGLPPPHLASQRVPADADHETASFAAALAGGRTRLAEESSAAKLQFSMGRRVLERHMTIFQAIQAQAQAAEEDADEDDAREADVLLPTSGRRLWDAVYTISYATAPPQPPAAAAVAGDATPNDAPAGPSAGAGEVGAGSPLDVVRAPWLPEEVAPSRRAVREVLELLRLLEALSQLVPRMRAEAAADAVAEGRHATLQEAVREQQVRSIVRIEEFLSTKITPKLTRQMQDALALCSGSLPPWVHHLTAACPFLFPFEARRQYFHATAFGLSRALQRLQAQQSSDGAPVALDRDGREVRVGRLQRQKVRVSRQRILESAAKVFELYAAHKAVLEVEYFGEVGTGLGPTLEFYTLLSHELQKKHLQLWRADGPALPDPKMADAPLDSDADLMDLDDPAPPGAPPEAVLSAVPAGSPSVCAESSFVHAPHGLFPRPLAPAAPGAERQRVVDHFRLLGRAMAKALQDNRMLDLPLAPAFYKLALGQALDLHDLVRVDPPLGQQLEQLDVLIRRKKHLEVAGGAPGGAALLMGGVSVEELCLDFTLPGYPEYELKPGGGECSVTLGNLEEYVRLLLRASLADGVAPQVDAFRAGFNQVFPLASLRLFTPDELEALLCGKRELWTPESLAEHIKFDHGYTAGSPPIQHLLAIMGEFTPDEQRSFLRFVTGAPRLPPGGLSALTPRLTIVRKHPSGGTPSATLGSTPPGSALAPGTTLADGDLPSVMTCANYLKLPPYSCKAVMKDRLLYAIKEGQGSFDLS